MSFDEERSQLIEAYWAHHRLFHSHNRSDRLKSESVSWADDAVTKMIGLHDRAAVELVQQLAETAADESQIAFVGCGPLEDLLFPAKGEPPVDDLDTALRLSKKLRSAFRSAWVDFEEHPLLAPLKKYQVS